MLKLTDKELFNQSRNKGELYNQYKARRRTINLATRYYIKSKLSNEKTTVRDYVGVILETANVNY